MSDRMQKVEALKELVAAPEWSDATAGRVLVERGTLRLLFGILEAAEAKVARVEVLPQKWRGMGDDYGHRRLCAIDLEAALKGERG